MQSRLKIYLLIIVFFSLTSCVNSQKEIKNLNHIMESSTTELEHRNPRNYSNKDVIIQLQLTPGGPGTANYQLSVYGDGTYTFTGSSKRDDINTSNESNYKNILTKETITIILDKGNAINFIDIVNEDVILQHVNDGQRTIFSLWQYGSLRKGQFGYGNYMNKETQELADYILSLVEN